MADARVHLNLIDSSRQLFELDPGAVIERGNGWLFGAGTPSHPVISNAAFRSGDTVDAEEFVARAKRFFDERGRGFSIWIRGEEPEDLDLATAAAQAGAQSVYEMPEMVLGSPVEEPDLPADAELRRLSEAGQADDYWKVAAASYTSIGFPPEVFGSYTDNAGLLAENIAAFIAYLDGEPVSIAMTIVSHGVAGIYWVGSLEQARGKGLGRAVTAAATNAGFELGAEIASLQASPMGKPIYEPMGYETVYDYRLFMSPPP
ncbi:MAG TPA: GNAT family N-acetyltransferase [Solirubrobacterales bacterium]|nr:GNAT family N-acetyltransferase [Solirubrobacterales bacterium]